jgi:23S rRNA pseudouridine2605 synthase
MTERIQKIIASRGIASRRKAEALIQAGRVTCNGRICLLGESADPDIDTILLDGKPLPSGGVYTYIMLHKPRGYVTTLSDEKGRKNVAQLVSGCGVRGWPVGRLDLDSEGLLIMTDDGDLTNKLLHPSHEVEKEYLVWVTGDVDAGLPVLSAPMVLDGDRLAPAKVRRGKTSGDVTQLSVIIHQGKNRQVRRMCAQAGLHVLRLKRVREGSVWLDRNLKPGQYRKLTAGELDTLLNEA